MSWRRPFMPVVNQRDAAYVAGPITNTPDARHRFERAVVLLRAAGWGEVVSPIEHPRSDEGLREAVKLGDRYDEGPVYRAIIRDCLLDLLRSDVVIALDGWRDSRGASFEVQVAWRAGIPVRTLDGEPVLPGEVVS